MHLDKFTELQKIRASWRGRPPFGSLLNLLKIQELVWVDWENSLESDVPNERVGAVDREEFEQLGDKEGDNSAVLGVGAEAVTTTVTV